jgi:uncharacterized protein (UPF0261 family)
MSTVLLLGTLDTKGEECMYVRARLLAERCDVVTIDAGVLGSPPFAAEFGPEDVARAAGVSLGELVDGQDRGAAVEAMGRGAAGIVRDLVAARKVSGVLVLGGSGGASLAARAMAELPIGFPKLIVSPVAAGDTRPYVQGADVAMLHPVVDLAGLNSISRRILANAAAAIAGMAHAYESFESGRGSGPQIGLTMFGITTPCVTRTAGLLADRGFEPLVFSANGVGGASMERLIGEGVITGVIDVTTTELADRLVGGILPAADDRLEVAGSLALPQVVSLGALDVVNFGPYETVARAFADRLLYRHNPEVTLMRTNADECRVLGAIIAAKLNAGSGERCVVVPLRGFSMLSAPGGPFYDPEADAALIDALSAELSTEIELIEVDAHINEPHVADTLADRFEAAYSVWGKETVTT